MGHPYAEEEAVLRTVWGGFTPNTRARVAKAMVKSIKAVVLLPWFSCRAGAQLQGEGSPALLAMKIPTCSCPGALPGRDAVWLHPAPAFPGYDLLHARPVGERGRCRRSCAPPGCPRRPMSGYRAWVEPAACFPCSLCPRQRECLPAFLD